MDKKPYTADTSLPQRSVRKRNIDYQKKGHIPYQIRRKFITPKNDMERLVEHGLKDIPWLTRLLEHTSMPAILDYAEERIANYSPMREADRQQCLGIIRDHYVRKRK